MDVETMRAIAEIESSKKPSSNISARTQYKGLYQLNVEEFKRGGGTGSIYSARENAAAFAKLVNEDKKWFVDRYGREPDSAEIYMMRQQGRGFFTAEKPSVRNISTNPYRKGMVAAQETRESFTEGWRQRIAEKRNVELLRGGPGFRGGRQVAEEQRMVEQLAQPANVNVNVRADQSFSQWARISRSHARNAARNNAREARRESHGGYM